MDTSPGRQEAQFLSAGSKCSLSSETEAGAPHQAPRPDSELLRDPRNFQGWTWTGLAAPRIL